MKQHTTPVIIKGEKISALEKVTLKSKSYNENWIQKICFQSPNLLPFEELEPSFNGMVPICMELSTNSGAIDLIFVNEDGFITIGECKLWRNPEARRKVVGQVLDYAKDIAKWNYSKFENECLKARKELNGNLFKIVQDYYPELEEASFIDNLQSNLKKGRFLLTIIGDGIRENMEELSDYIHRNGNLNFTLGLIELPVYKHPFSEELIITPRILAKTKEIERIIYNITGDKTIEDKNITVEKTVSKTISEKVFFERLQNAIGEGPTRSFQSFVESLKSELNITPKLGRGKKLSLNLKSADDTYNFASIQEDGQVWFYGIVSKTNELGDKQIGIGYLKELARAVNGQFIDSYNEWFWCVKQNNEYLLIVDYLKIQDQWRKILSEALYKINTVEFN
jgi:hypothetical protein